MDLDFTKEGNAPETTQTQNSEQQTNQSPEQNIQTQQNNQTKKVYTYNKNTPQEYFEYNGQRYDKVEDLPPEAIKEFYKTHQNIQNWRKSLTQGQQKVKEIERQYKEIEGQITAINNFFDQNPDLFEIIRLYKEAVDKGEDAKAHLLKNYFNQQMEQKQEQIPKAVRMPFESMDEFNKRIEEIEKRLKEKELAEIEQEAKKQLKSRFEDFDENEFEEYSKKFSEKDLSLSELMELVEKARRYEKYLAQQQAENATLLGTGFNIPPKQVGNNTEKVKKDSSAIFDDILKSVGFYSNK